MFNSDVTNNELYASRRGAGGDLEFARIVLNWDLKVISAPPSDTESISPLSASYPEPTTRHDPFPTSTTGTTGTTGTYFQNFKPLILEEARSVLQAGMEKVNAGNDS